MADMPSHPDTGEGTGAGSDLRPSTAGPRWRRGAAIAAGLALVVLFVVLHLTGVVGAGAH